MARKKRLYGVLAVILIATAGSGIFLLVQRVSGDFTITVSPSQMLLLRARSVTAALTITSIGHFNSRVSFLAVAVPGLDVSIDPPAVTPTPGGSADANLKISTSPTINEGDYTITVNAQSSSGSKSTVLGVSVLAVLHQVFLNADSTTGWNSTQPGPLLQLLLGDELSVTILNVNGGTHNFAVYPSGLGPGFPGDTGNPNAIARSATINPSSPSATRSIVFASATAYEYYCEFHPSTMHGQIIVRQPA